jgi:alpha-tubulin suppressor-like RCC1 family protein
MPASTLFSDVVANSLGHVLALDMDGRLFTWGYNGYGQLGNSATDRVLSPTQIYVSGDIRFQSIANGWYQSMALAKNGDIYTWGRGYYGVLGHGNTANRYTPTKLNTGLTYRAIAMGDQTAMAITEEGKLYVWGHNIYGQYGNGSTASKYIPQLVPLY